MMKVKVLIVAFMIAGIAPAQANDQGAWVKVDANGNAIGGAIVCTPDVCGNVNSEYAKATLGAGEQYVLQAKADPITGNVAGIGNNNPGVQVKVDLVTHEWTITRNETVAISSAILAQEVANPEPIETSINFFVETAPWSMTKEIFQGNSVVEKSSLLVVENQPASKLNKIKKAKAKKRVLIK